MTTPAQFFSGTVGKVLKDLCELKKPLEFIYMGDQDEFLRELAQGHDFDKTSPVVGHLVDIKFVPSWNALVPILYDSEPDDEDSEGASKRLVVWGMLSQLREDDSLDAETLTRRLSILRGARADGGLADNVDLTTNVALSATSPPLLLRDVLARWFQIVTV